MKQNILAKVIFVVYIVIIITILSLFALVYLWPEKIGDNRNAQSLNTNTLKNVNNNAKTALQYPLPDLIADYKANKIKYGTFITTGFIVDQRICPPCPTPGLCEPCMPNAVLVGFTMDATDLVSLLTDNPKYFTLGKVYDLTFVYSEKSIEPTITKSFQLLPPADTNINIDVSPISANLNINKL